MKRAFVTGASGFIGAALVRILLAHDVDVAVLQRRSTIGHRLQNLQANLTFLRAPSGTDLPEISELETWKPDTVFHLGWGGVGAAQRNEARLQLRNLQLSADLAQICCQIGVEHFVVAGSQAEYGPKDGPITETDNTNPTTLYGAAKLSALHFTKCLCDLQHVRHAWLRIFSTYGPGDNPDWLLPSLINKLKHGQRPSLTPGEQKWDYLHVNDAARAFFLVAEKRVSGVYNVGSGRAIPLRDVICMIRDAINPAAPLGFGDVPYRPDQVMHLQADVSAIGRATGWAPSVLIENGIAELLNAESDT